MAWLAQRESGEATSVSWDLMQPQKISLGGVIDQFRFAFGTAKWPRFAMPAFLLDLGAKCGDLANRLMHPRYGVQKAYLVLVAGNPRPEDLKKLMEGVWLSEGHVKARHVKRLKKQGNSTWLRNSLGAVLTQSARSSAFVSS